MLPRRLIAASVVVLACADPAAPDQAPDVLTALPRQLSGAEQAIVNSTPAFGLELLRQVNRTWADSNVFLSPLSASMALGMTMNGAAGGTYEEMRTTLGLPDRPLAELNAGYKSLITLLRSLDRSVDLRIGNSIWLDQRFAPAVSRTFQDDLKTYFEATSTGLDFGSPQAITTINNWVKTSTNGKIDKILERIPPEMVMYLINAIYFKGAWRDPFDPAATQPGAFTSITGQRVTMPMMTRKGKFRAATVNGVQVVELPYGNDTFVMTLAMPPEGQSVNAFIAGLTPATWTALSATLAPSTADLYLPRFSLSWADRLNDKLQGMGMRQPFIPGGADFTRLSPSAGRELYISDVRQRAIVEVNEVGTVAAAVTSVGVGVTSLPVSIRLDRPFVFAIRERLSGTLLFMGKLARPVV